MTFIRKTQNTKHKTHKHNHLYNDYVPKEISETINDYVFYDI